MNFKKLTSRLAAVTMSSLLIASSLSVPVFAASSDTIDMTATGSIEIHKYDITVAEECGVDTSALNTPTGKTDEAVETQLANYVISGVEFTYLRVGDIKTWSVSDDATSSIEVIYGIDADLMEILSLSSEDAVTIEGSAYYFTSNQLNNATQSALESANTDTKNALEAYIVSNKGTAMTLTDENGTTYADGLAVGLYLVVETKVPENVFYTTNPFFVSIPSTDVDGEDWFYDLVLYPKNQTDIPDIEKKVSEEGIGHYADSVTASEGDILDYSIYSHLPKITSSASYLTKYTFVDTASKGLTYLEDSVAIYFYNSAADCENGDTTAAIATWSLDSGYFTVSYAGKSSTDHTMTIEMTDAGLLELNTNTDLAEKYLCIQYQVVLDSNAETVLGDTGNPNDVTLTWSRTNTLEEQTITDRSMVFTFGIIATKTFEGDDGSADATKVSFVLYNATDDYWVVASEYADGLYYVTGQAETEEEGTVFHPASNGNLTIKGLEADEYVMTETATDAGYSLLKDTIVINFTTTVPTITATTASRTYVGAVVENLIYVDGDASTATVDGNAVAMVDGVTGEDNGLAPLTIINTITFTLPQTGGSGLMLLTILGICGVTGGFFVAFGGRKKEEE